MSTPAKRAAASIVSDIRSGKYRTVSTPRPLSAYTAVLKAYAQRARKNKGTLKSYIIQKLRQGMYVSNKSRKRIAWRSSRNTKIVERPARVSAVDAAAHRDRRRRARKATR